MAVSSRFAWTVSSDIKRGVTVQRSFKGTFSECDALLQAFYINVEQQLRYELSYRYTGDDITKAAKGLKFMLKEKVEGHQLHRRHIWKTHPDAYSSTSDISCALNDNQTTELFIFNVSGGVTVTEKYTFFLRFVKYVADIRWCVTSIKSDSAEGQRNLRRAFDSVAGDKKEMSELMYAVNNPHRIRIEKPTEEPEIHSKQNLLSLIGTSKNPSFQKPVRNPRATGQQWCNPMQWHNPFSSFQEPSSDLNIEMTLLLLQKINDMNLDSTERKMVFRFAFGTE